MSNFPVGQPGEEQHEGTKRKEPLAAIVGIFGLLTVLIGIAAPFALFLWAVGAWSPTLIMRVILSVFLAGLLIHYVKTRPSKRVVYALLGMGLAIVIVRWLLGR